jgi:hypothetical protein
MITTCLWSSSWLYRHFRTHTAIFPPGTPRGDHRCSHSDRGVAGTVIVPYPSHYKSSLAELFSFGAPPSYTVRRRSGGCRAVAEPRR